jgi:hypothetical protein
MAHELIIRVCSNNRPSLIELMNNILRKITIDPSETKYGIVTTYSNWQDSDGRFIHTEESDNHRGCIINELTELV